MQPFCILWLLNFRLKSLLIKSLSQQKDLSSKFCTTCAKKKKKNIAFEQYAGIHLDCPKVCETTSDMVFVLNPSFTAKDEYFRMAIAEACYTQKLETYDHKIHQVNPHFIHWIFEPTILTIHVHSHLFRHPSLMMLFLNMLLHSFLSSTQKR